MNAPISGFNTPQVIVQANKDADDANEAKTKNTLVQGGNPSSKGVILTQDSLEVPLEIQNPIQNDRYNQTRPTLPPAVQLLLASSKPGEAPNFYDEVFDKLSDGRQNSIAQNSVLQLDDQNQELTAFNHVVNMGADLLGASHAISNNAIDSIADIKTFQELPDKVQAGIIGNVGKFITLAEEHLNKIGPNDPAYDQLSAAIGKLKSAGNTLLDLEDEG